MPMELARCRRWYETISSSSEPGVSGGRAVSGTIVRTGGEVSTGESRIRLEDEWSLGSGRGSYEGTGGRVLSSGEEGDREEAGVGVWRPAVVNDKVALLLWLGAFGASPEGGGLASGRWDVRGVGMLKDGLRGMPLDVSNVIV